jgi:hypothetical protein
MTQGVQVMAKDVQVLRVNVHPTASSVRQMPPALFKK